MKGFKSIKNEYIPDVIDYTLNLLQADPKLRIYVGTDSQNHSNNTTMVTVIAYRKSFNRGVHFIYKKELLKPKLKTMVTRLLLEAEKTIEVADFLINNSVVKIEAVEFDVNKDTNAGSNAVLSSVQGWGIGLGYKVIVKPDELVAVKAANEMCR